jgi:hypothetical protein
MCSARFMPRIDDEKISKSSAEEYVVVFLYYNKYTLLYLLKPYLMKVVMSWMLIIPSTFRPACFAGPEMSTFRMLEASLGPLSAITCTWVTFAPRMDKKLHMREQSRRERVLNFTGLTRCRRQSRCQRQHQVAEPFVC